MDAAITLRGFNESVVGRLGVSLRRYQEDVAREILSCLDQGCRHVVVSMPTGSGKTLLEMFIAYYFLSRLCKRVLVVEPTRFLCDQMYSRLWGRVFGDIVGKEYEGECVDFLNPGKKIVIATPQTALKCSSHLEAEPFDAVIIDEAHHAFGGRHYAELITSIRPCIVVGFTALLPGYRLSNLDPRIELMLGAPRVLSYDFKKLVEMDSSFEPPKAIADLFDAEMDELEARVYEELFMGRVEGDPRTIKRLEITLVRYGSMALRESYENALEKSRMARNLALEELCNSIRYSHKARVLLDVLRIYDIWNNNDLKPVLVFTSRKTTAGEFREAIVKELGLQMDRVQVLTSDMDRDERRELVERAKGGDIDVIISTLVGEEGVDIPETGLLVMTDVPKSPLRFYQRLGRLIRLASPRKLKYLVITLTPKTYEYLDLEDALWNLYSEEVDVSFIIMNIDARGPTARVDEILERFSTIYNDVAVPYTLITQGRELSNPLNYVVSIAKQNKDFLDVLKETFQLEGIELDLSSDDALERAIFNLTTLYFLRAGDKMKRAYDRLDKLMNKGRFANVLSEAIRTGRVFYIYDIDKMALLIAEGLKHLYRKCIERGKQYCEERFFRLDKKWVLRLYAKLFMLEHIGGIKDKLQRYVRDLESSLRSVLDKSLSVYIERSDYHAGARMLAPRICLFISLDSISLYFLAQVNYYDVGGELCARNDIYELIRLNLEAIGYKAIEYFLEWLEASDSNCYEHEVGF